MPQNHKLNNPIITGTLLLTLAGLFGKIIGFFYRIFLSRTIGAEGLGIYQLIFPVLSISLAVTASGVSTAISKYVAQYLSKAFKCSRIFLRDGLVISTSLSVLAMFLLQRYAGFLADYVLLEPRCEGLIVVLSYSIPLASIHDCINGYYYGKKLAKIPAFSQIIEQAIRVLSVFLIYQIQTEAGKSITSAAAVWGLVFGEFFSFLFSITALSLEKKPSKSPCGEASGSLRHPYRMLISYSIPLTANRLALTLFASFESILIPSRLRLFGYTQTEALSVYGILTGMAFSIIMAPTVLSNAVSVMMLPAISEAQSRNDTALIHRAIKKTVACCLLLGFACTLLFLLTGRFIGEYLFGNSLAGTFIVTLSWICPFLFLSSILSSVLHGLGTPGTVFALNLAGSLVRICFVFFLIPVYGLKAYLFGMLVSQILVAGLCLACLYRKRR